MIVLVLALLGLAIFLAVWEVAHLTYPHIDDVLRELDEKNVAN